MRIFAICILSFVLFSCSKEDELFNENSNSLVAVMPLTVGSFWVYDRFVIDGGDTTFQYTDTISIISEELIDGHQYAVFSQQLVTFPQRLRQSNDTLYTENQIYAILQKADSIHMNSWVIPNGQYEIILDSYMISTQRMFSVGTEILPAFNRRSKFNTTDPDIPDQNNCSDHYIVDNVGITEFTWISYSDPVKGLFKLVAFHIE